MIYPFGYHRGSQPGSSLMTRRSRGRCSLPFFFVVLLVLACVWVVPGCGQADYYPEAKVTTPVGQPGECVFCRKEIETVTEDQLATIQGTRYVVCDENCAAEQEKWIRSH